METLVLDTNIVSYLMRGHSFAEPYRPHLVGKRLAVSFMTVAEMYEGAYRGGWDEVKISAMERELKKYLVIPYSAKLAGAWGAIRAERRLQPISTDDAWIAAAAVAHQCPLVTHNPNDFRGITHLRLITEPQPKNL